MQTRRRRTGSDLTEEEIAATIARADQRPDDFATQRNIGVAIYRYGSIKQNARLYPAVDRLLDRAASTETRTITTSRSALGTRTSTSDLSTKTTMPLHSPGVITPRLSAAKPNDADVLVDLALTYYLQTPPDLDSSVNEFRKALAANPKHEKTLQFMIQALLKQNKAAEASDLLAAAANGKSAE